MPDTPARRTGHLGIIGTFDPPDTLGGSRTVASEVVRVPNELVLGEVVRAWVGQELPGDAEAAARVAARAQAAYARGASVGEACYQARAYLASWLRHPAHRKVDRDVLVPLAS